MINDPHITPRWDKIYRWWCGQSNFNSSSLSYNDLSYLPQGAFNGAPNIAQLYVSMLAFIFPFCQVFIKMYHFWHYAAVILPGVLNITCSQLCLRSFFQDCHFRQCLNALIMMLNRSSFQVFEVCYFENSVSVYSDINRNRSLQCNLLTSLPSNIFTGLPVQTMWHIVLLLFYHYYHHNNFKN